MAADVKKLEAENAAMREALFGKHGVESGLAIIEKCLATAVKGDHGDSPFGMDPTDAKLWHRAQMEAYRHVLEMITVDPALAPAAINYNVLLDGRNIGVYGGRSQHEVMNGVAKDFGFSSYDEARKQHPVNEGKIELVPVKAVEAEVQPFTVIGHNEFDRTLFVEHVDASDGLNAFAVAAARQPEAEFSVAIKGTLTESENVLTFPGEGLVPSGVVLTDPEVFGKVNVDSEPANEPN